MDRLYEWVDADDPNPNADLSPRRTTRLLCAILLSSLIVTLPAGIITLGVQSAQHATPGVMTFSGNPQTLIR